MNEDRGSTAQRVYADDEISLVDIWLTLVRHKRIIIVCFIFCLLAGLALALIMPKKYTYSSIIEIGSTIFDKGNGIETSLIENPETVQAKLTESYIPLAQAESNKDLEESAKIYEITTKIPKGSQLVVLQSKGGADEESVYTKLHRLVVERMLVDHRKVIEVPKKQYEVGLAQASLKLEELEDPRIFAVRENELKSQIQQAKSSLQEIKGQAKLLAAKAQHLEKTKELLQQQVNEVGSILAVAQENRVKAVGEVGDEAKALTLLMIDNQIEQNRTRLASLEERFYIDLMEKKQQLEKQLDDNKRGQEMQKTKIDELKAVLVKLNVDHEQAQNLQKQNIAQIENKISALRPSRALATAVRSLKPAGPGKAIILALSAILGLMGGVLLAFVVEFFRRIRQQAPIAKG